MVAAPLALASPLALAASRAMARTRTALRLGITPDYQNASLPAIAAAHHMWHDEALTAEIHLFPDGPSLIEAIEANHLDIAAIGPGALWLPATGRTKVIAINLLTRGDRLVLQPGIAGLPDLRGRRVAVPQASPAAAILRTALRHHGLETADVELVPMHPATLAAAFAANQIAGAAIWHPLVEILRRRVPDLQDLALDTQAPQATTIPHTIVASADLLRSDPAPLSRLLRVIKRAMDLRVAHPDRAAALSAALLGLQPDAMIAQARTAHLLTSAELEQRTRDGTVHRWLAGFTETFQAFGTLHDPLPPSRWYEAELFVTA